MINGNVPNVVNGTLTVVPEPGSAALALGGLLFGLVRRTRQAA